MSAREDRRRREGWFREGVVYEYIAAVPEKKAPVEFVVVLFMICGHRFDCPA